VPDAQIAADTACWSTIRNPSAVAAKYGRAPPLVPDTTTALNDLLDNSAVPAPLYVAPRVGDAVSDLNEVLHLRQLARNCRKVDGRVGGQEALVSGQPCAVSGFLKLPLIVGDRQGAHSLDGLLKKRADGNQH
jgi:hypothetical protein